MNIQQAVIQRKIEKDKRQSESGREKENKETKGRKWKEIGI